MTNTMTPDTVIATIRSKGTKFATVTFVKKDGSERVVNGLFQPTSKMVGSDKGMAMGEAMRGRGQVAIWSPAEGWKSFFADKVVSIK